MKISRNLQRVLFGIAASASVLGITARALACQYGVGTSDTALMNTFPIPVFNTAKKFVIRQAWDFNTPDWSWTQHGFEEWADPKYEYAKLWMASYLISEGTYFATTGKTPEGGELLFDRAFHTAYDYYSMAKGEPEYFPIPGTQNPEDGSYSYTATHGTYSSLLGGFRTDAVGEYSPKESISPAAMLFWPLAFFPEKSATVTTFCGLYDVLESTPPPLSVYLPSNNIHGTPAERATTLVHESMHAHYRDVAALSHVNCATGQPSDTGTCDLFFPHKKSDYVGGDLATADGGSRKLPAFETEYEYLCDLLDESKDWVPLAMLTDTQGVLARDAATAFVDSKGNQIAPPYTCGTPSPMMARPAGAPACQIGECGPTMACSQGICDEGCCIVVK